MERDSTRSCKYRCCTGTYSLDAVARIGSANIWPLFGSANQLLSALVERTIGLVKAYAAGSATFLVEGLQLIIAILLMALGLIIVINSLKAYFKAQKESA